MVASLRSHRTALRLPGVPWLRTVLRSVCSPLQPFGPPPFAKRTCDVPCFTGVFVPACASLARYSGAAERFALFLNSQWSSCCALRLAVLPPLSSAWSPLCVRTALRFACAVFRGCALRFAPCARHSSPSGLRRSQSSLEMLPASLGSSAAIAPSIRNGRPAAPFGLQYSLAHWAYYGLFRALRAAFVSPTGCAASFALIGLPLRLFPPLAAAKLRPHWAYYGLFRALRAAFVRPTGCTASFAPFIFNPQNRLPLSFLAAYSAAAEAEGEACAEADASGEASGAGDGEGGAVVPGVSSERISPSCTVML